MVPGLWLVSSPTYLPMYKAAVSMSHLSGCWMAACNQHQRGLQKDLTTDQILLQIICDGSLVSSLAGAIAVDVSAQDAGVEVGREIWNKVSTKRRGVGNASWCAPVQRCDAGALVAVVFSRTKSSKL